MECLSKEKMSVYIVESFRAFLYNIGDLLKLGPANVTGLPIDTLGTVELAIGWVRSRFINVQHTFFGCSQIIDPDFKAETRML